MDRCVPKTESIPLGESAFRIPCAATLLTILCDTDAEFGSTMIIILAALATEYSRVVALAPVQLLLGICHRLKGILRAYSKWTSPDF